MISKRYTNNVNGINSLFCGCLLSNELPYISKWNTSNIININSFFESCSSLNKILDISKWNMTILQIFFIIVLLLMLN